MNIWFSIFEYNIVSRYNIHLYDIIISYNRQKFKIDHILSPITLTRYIIIYVITDIRVGTISSFITRVVCISLLNNLYIHSISRNYIFIYNLICMLLFTLFNFNPRLLLKEFTEGARSTSFGKLSQKASIRLTRSFRLVISWCDILKFKLKDLDLINFSFRFSYSI